MLWKIEKAAFGNERRERIRFTDSAGLEAFIEDAVPYDTACDSSRAIWIGEEFANNSIRLERDQVEALVAHLQAWLATRSFEIKTGPPTRPGREPVSETVEDDGIVQEGGDSVESSKLRVFFDVDESHPAELQLMTIWSKSFDHFEVPSDYARAALLWFTEYAKSKIAARDLAAGER